MKKLSIAVLVTAYNHEDFIQDCANSIANQTRKPDKIILADDNSTDNTIKKFNHIIPNAIISKGSENNGALLNTRNGLNYALDCEIVCFLDGDDVWSENKLARVEQDFEKDPSLLLLSHKHMRCDKDLIPLNINDDTHQNIKKIMSLPISRQQDKLRESALMRYGFWFGSAYSIRLIEKNLIAFDQFINGHNLIKNAYFDLVFSPFLIALNPSMKVKYMDDVTFKYRLHNSGSGDAQNYSKQVEVYKRLQSNNIITLFLLNKILSSAKIKNRYEELIREHQYLIDLYGSKRIVVMDYLFLLKYFIQEKKFIKELLRFLSVIFIGSNNSIILKNNLVFFYRKIKRYL